MYHYRKVSLIGDGRELRIVRDRITIGDGTVDDQVESGDKRQGLCAPVRSEDQGDTEYDYFDQRGGGDRPPRPVTRPWRVDSLT